MNKNLQKERKIVNYKTQY